MVGYLPMNRSLAHRLAVSAGLAMLVVVAVFWAATLVLVGHELHGSLDAGLRTRAIDVAQLAVSDPAILNQPGALESPTSGRQLAVEVLDSRGRILARSVTLGASLLPSDQLVRVALTRGRPGFESITLGGRPFRVYVAPIADATGPASRGAVLVASETGDVSHTLSRLGLVLGVAGLVVAVLGIAGVSILTARGTAPLRRLATEVQEIERTADPARRLPPNPRPDELGRLTGVLNGMLEALQQARDGERRFLADASHELRTPVTSLIGNIEFLGRHGAEPGVLEDLRGDAERLGRLVEDLLTLERGGATVAEPQPVELSALARRVVAELGEPRVTVAGAPEAFVLGDDGALARALRNLIDNALRHGPASGPVRVSLAVVAGGGGGEARITVADAGPGPAPEERERVFERFWRAPDATGRPGSGLGLSIVATVAAAHGGTVELDGAAFTMVIPTAANLT